MTLDGTQVLDSRRFRDVVGHFASGIVVITSTDDDTPVGLTCQSFYSVSLEPAMISFSVSAGSKTYPRIRESGRFCINLLAAHQSAVSAQFAVSSANKWAGISWRMSDMGNPIIDETVGWIDCSLAHEFTAGDHLIVVGQVHDLDSNPNPQEPLLYFRGEYRHLRDS